MTIKTNSGKIYELQGPSFMLKNQGKYWKNEDIKYINFENYGKIKREYNTIEIIKKENTKINIPKIENKPIIQESVPQPTMQPVIQQQPIKQEDNYLEAYTKQKFKETIEKIEFEQQETYKISADAMLESAGSTVCIIDSMGQTKCKKYAVIIDDKDKTRTLLIKDYKFKNNESIICEWDNTKWKIKKHCQQNNNSIVDLI